MLRQALTFAVVLLSFSVTAGTQQIQPSPLRGAGTDAVVADVVVRDARGNPVSGLTKADFQLLEDGIVQQIGDVTVIGGEDVAATNARPPVAPTTAGSATTTTPPTGGTNGPSYMALVFDRLSPEARAASYKGALAVVEGMRSTDHVAVFLADLSLITIQPYTNDREKVRAAIKDVSTRATSVFDRKSSRKIGASESAGDADPSVDWTAGAESGGRFADPNDPSLIILTRDLWEIMARNQQGFATTDALVAVASALGTRPGRKTVVFFAEGLALPPAVYPLFKNVVTTANRGNVSFYTIDAAGLRVHSEDGETGRAVRAIGAAGIAQTSDGSNQSSLGLLEINEDVLRKNPRTSLTLLARETGGFLVDNTNDLAKAFRQIDRDRRNYYLLTYQPTNTNFDGRWRSIAVKVPGRRATISARSGYLAVKAPVGMPLLAYEGPALAALSRTPPPSELPLRSIPIVFPHGRVAVLASTDGSALRFDRDEVNNTYKTDFTILARIVDANARVVRSASQPYRLAGPTANIERAKGGEILFYRQPTVPPGRYTLEVALQDALAARATVQRIPFVVSGISSLQVSSLVVVQRAERIKPEEQNQDNPLVTGDLLLYPNLGEPLRKSRQKTVGCFAVIEPVAGPSPSATLQVVHDTTEVDSMPVPLTPDGASRLRAVAEMSLDKLPVGHYVLRLIVTQGDRREIREASVEVRD
jgi:VWFA-related protein